MLVYTYGNFHAAVLYTRQREVIVFHIHYYDGIPAPASNELGKTRLTLFLHPYVSCYFGVLVALNNEVFCRIAQNANKNTNISRLIVYSKRLLMSLTTIFALYY